nr:MAG TPA: hypothetical protein [Caudoviricetes sp.]
MLLHINSKLLKNTIIPPNCCAKCRKCFKKHS